jgi:DNA-binding CsgD family transcriptional regulator
MTMGSGREGQIMLMVEACRKTGRNKGAATVRLTPRELQLAQLVSSGHQNKEIAYALGIREGTVKVYLSNLFAKMGLFNRADLSAWAVRHDLEIRSAMESVPKPAGWGPHEPL